MKGRINIIFSVITVVGFIALSVPAYFFITKNKIGQTNTLIEKARRDYFAREFLSAYKTYELLIDSFHFDHDAASMNYANAAFMSSSILKGGFYGRANDKAPVLSDTILQKLAQESEMMYTILTTSTDSKIASMAYNQLGYSAIKSNKSWSSEGSTDTVLVVALENFKQALKENPNNDSARYNYELIRKVIGFPETVLAETRSLVAQHRYIEAATLLESSMERDLRLMKQKEFLDRIKAVAKIDTTYRRKRI